MLTLITAALAAAQPAPANMQAPQPQHGQPGQHAQHAQHGQMQMPMQPQQHHSMKDSCPCCKNMGHGEQHRQSPGERPSHR